MKKKIPPLNWLRTFEASARTLSFTQAASELNMTQAAVSQHIKGLEAQLGVALFNRLPRGLELSQAGKAYIPIVHDSIERLADATNELFGKGQMRPLTVRTNLVFFTTWLAPRIGKFRAQNPDVNIRFSSNIWVGDIDRESNLEIRHGEGEWPNVNSDRLTWDKLVPVCSPNLLDGKTRLSPQDLENFTLLHVMGYRAGWAYWLKQAGFLDVDSSQGIHFDTLISALEMAKAGQGIALGRSSLVQEMLRSGELIAPFDVSIPTSEAFYLISPVNQYEHPQAGLFRDWLLAEAADNKDCE